MFNRKINLFFKIFILILIIYLVLVLLTQSKILRLYNLIAKQKYKHNINNLYDNTNTKNKKIVFCSTVRNIEDCIEKNLNFLIHIGKTYFKEYCIILFENDSEDNTREIIIKYSNKYPGQIILLDCCKDCKNCCDCKLQAKKMHDYGGYSETRIKKMSEYRNRYLEYIKKYYNNYDYMLVVDLDIDGSMSIKKFLKNFELTLDWDVLIVNGVSPSIFTLGIGSYRTYDDLAFEPYIKNYENVSKDNIGINKLMNKSINKAKRKKQLLRVNSGFNGMALYKIRSILETNAKYDYKTGCEHRDFHKHFKNVYINPQWKLYAGIYGNTNFFSLLKNYKDLIHKREIL